jgi:hypothetical protein
LFLFNNSLYDFLVRLMGAISAIGSARQEGAEDSAHDGADPWVAAQRAHAGSAANEPVVGKSQRSARQYSDCIS